jgi:hypothetical protein
MFNITQCTNSTIKHFNFDIPYSNNFAWIIITYKNIAKIN